MKKNIIWLLATVMGITFAALLYFQISYLNNMVRMRESQFSENVMRCLHATAQYLEREETLHYLESDMNVIESSFYDPDSPNDSIFADASAAKSDRAGFPSPTQNVADRYRRMQHTIRTQYLYQKGLLNEVILTIMRDSGTRPAIERADSTTVRKFLATELAANGLNVPFDFAVYTHNGTLVYQTDGFSAEDSNDGYSATLFPNSSFQYKLVVDFPTRESYIFSTVRFVIPAIALTIILLAVFILTIVLALRQKKITEIKTDFINNMTHELKTPISTISLAAQMLSDDTVRKSPTSLKHLSSVITEEAKRLRFQVDKVLQLSVFDDAAALKFTDVDANDIIANVVNTFKIKVEKFGGALTCHLDASNSEIHVDEMQFTNVIFNLLDNAVKYRNEEVNPLLEITTRNSDPNTLEIRVRDNGIGIKKDDLKRIFEKFYRVPTGNRHDVKGFGLGLAYVRKMVSIFSGDISVESELGKFTEFIIHIPLAR